MLRELEKRGALYALALYLVAPWLVEKIDAWVMEVIR